MLKSILYSSINPDAMQGLHFLLYLNYLGISCSVLVAQLSSIEGDPVYESWTMNWLL